MTSEEWRETTYVMFLREKVYDILRRDSVRAGMVFTRTFGAKRTFPIGFKYSRTDGSFSIGSSSWKHEQQAPILFKYFWSFNDDEYDEYASCSSLFCARVFFYLLQVVARVAMNNHVRHWDGSEEQQLLPYCLLMLLLDVLLEFRDLSFYLA